MNNKIKILDDNTINKIAAGEVIERPASIVKELIENSIDAESTSITIEIKNGGKSYIRITDNGKGINPEDVQLAFLRHSTSKISSSNDLSNILSLGFRGEALASISSISMVELITKTDDNDVGKSIEIHGGILKRELDTGAPKGTTIIVKNVFYNTPVRKKFLKSDGSESAKISDIINKLAMCNPDISFNYIKDNRSILKTPGNGDIKSTIYSIYGKEYIESLIDINFQNNDDFKIQGYISKPSLTRGNRNNELFFVNKRYVNSLILSKAVEDAYSSLITINRYPVVFLYLDLNPQDIDVNVHPSKIEIKIENETKVINKIKEIIRKKLLGENLVPKINLSKENNQDKQENIIDIINTTKTVSTSSIDNKEMDLSNNKYNESLSQTVDVDKVYENNYISNDNDYNGHNELNIKNKKENEISSNNPSNNKEIFPDLNILGRVFDTYIIGEDKELNSLYMIDQHAAHERVMYEKFRKQYEEEEVIIQPLLISENLDLNHQEYQLVLNNIQLFRKLGFDIDEFGSNTIILRGVPMVFGVPDGHKLFIEILDNLNNEINNRYELKVEKIMKMSCTNAIKAGDYIGKIEINKLISDLKNCNNPFTCPHGRPITIKITKYELEKMFKRIQ
ncbi:DNA mismatch repair endonuclease MutL [Clostridium sp. D2Q-14]|uniref:DNA mismatch repair endonuclease MutL n=1 Tax=Anaeromonas gelatinilytica TaxID=2683194 RepID=UPI00193AF54B|nr:DNA mismatch repair endonuclease MutL [Anaeromonas gelatinilytica]MBS4535972.1 DNA mismatch repair endonuclease MutL [Anaeromonas gelatinilytica]